MNITDYHLGMIELKKFYVTYFCKKCFRFFVRKDLLKQCRCGDPLTIVELEARR